MSKKRTVSRLGRLPSGVEAASGARIRKVLGKEERHLWARSLAVLHLRPGRTIESPRDNAHYPTTILSNNSLSIDIRIGRLSKIVLSIFRRVSRMQT